MAGFTIDTRRMLADLDALRGIGAVETGVVRPAYSETDRLARAWLVERMEASMPSAMSSACRPARINAFWSARIPISSPKAAGWMALTG